MNPNDSQTNCAREAYVSKLTPMIHCELYERSKWPTTQWTEKQTFACDRCHRVVLAYRISCPTKYPIHDIKTGLSQWTGLFLSCCSLSCCFEMVFSLRELNTTEVLTYLTLMFRRVYGFYGPIPPPVSKIEQLPYFSTVRKT